MSSLQSVARGFRTGLLAGLRGSGITQRIAASRWRQERLLILCYHGVSLRDEHQWHDELFVTPAFLRRRFELIRDLGYQVLPLGDVAARLRAGDLPARSVVLTFDDGFHNFYAGAAPLLKEFGFPATVYLSTYHCLHQRPLLSLSIRYFLWRASRNQPATNYRLPSGVMVNVAGESARISVSTALVSEARKLSADRTAQMAWLEALAISLGVDWNDFMRSRILHLMDQTETAAVAAQGLDVQLHTHRHRSPIDEALFSAEVQENQRIISDITGKTARHFCYPSGVIHREFLPWLRNLNIETATTCDANLATRHSDPLLLPRFIDTMGQSELYFVSWLSGASNWLRRRASDET